MRKSTLYITGMIIGCCALIYMLSFHTMGSAKRLGEAMHKKSELVEVLQLTDLCLFTEARYTRHLSQSDLYAPFQDHPISFEHFPSGSLTLPPQRRRR